MPAQTADRVVGQEEQKQRNEPTAQPDEPDANAIEQNEPADPTPAPDADVPKCSTDDENAQNEPTEVPQTQHSALTTQHSPSLTPVP